MNDKWNEYVERAERIFPEGVKLPRKDKHYRKHHLGNIIDWLKLAETPLQAAQQAVAEGLKAYWDANNPASLFTLTDVAQTVNMTVSLVGHARDIVSTLIAELEGLPEPKPSPETQLSGLRTCSNCRKEFDGLLERFIGKACPHCGNRDLPEPKPLPEMQAPKLYTCADCESSFDVARTWRGADHCPDCGSKDFDVTIPF